MNLQDARKTLIVKWKVKEHNITFPIFYELYWKLGVKFDLKKIV